MQQQQNGATNTTRAPAWTEHSELLATGEQLATCGVVFCPVTQGKFDTSLHNPRPEKSNHSTTMIMIIAVADTIIDLFPPPFFHIHRQCF